MERNYLNMRFVDEFGKSYTLRVDDAKTDLDSDNVELVARTVIESNAFRQKGMLKSLVVSDLITINTENLVDHRE